MKKVILYLSTVVFVGIVGVSCNKVLNVKPQNIVTGSQILSSKKSVQAELATLYSQMPLEDFNFHAHNTYHGYTNGWLEVLSGLTMENKDHNINSIPGDGTWLEWWNQGYSSVRQINKFIASVKKSKKFSKQQLDQWLGEALFIRAYDYFGLVKRYGGIPLITHVQNYTGNNLTKLQVPRNKEKKIYDFISTELDSAATLMGPTSPAGRANKYVALALKSRVMLFAASEAEYAPVQMNGLLGIPSSDADQYWKQAYNAANKIIQSGQYSLYDKYPNDRAKNFDQLFLHAKDNPEVIFAKYYQYPQKVHHFDLWRLPYEYRSPHGYSSDDAPTVQLLQAFDYKDGSNGKLKIKNSQGQRIEYKNPLDLFKNKDPRLFATAILPFSKWKGKVVHVRAGIIDNGDTITTNNFNDTYKGMNVIGASGIGGGEVSSTGMYMRKHLNPNYPASRVNSGSATPWIAFRLGGVLLNYAEAAAELGKMGDAARAINKLHARAGIAPVKPSQVTVNTVRHEDKVEEVDENKYYWDMRRWRIADKVLDNYYCKALYPFYNYQDKAYVFKTVKVGYSETFQPRMYYEKIPSGEISKDPKLKQNPGY